MYDKILTSPLDQFRILPIFQFNLGFLDLSFTNSALTLILALGSFLSIAYLIIYPALYLTKADGIFLVPNNRWFLLIENLYLVITSLLFDNVGIKGEVYFPFLFVIFVFVLQSNLIGLIPYSFTATSHIIVTFSLSLIVFIGVNIVGINIHRIHFLNLFLPSGTALPLAFLLVPLEIVSFLSKPISLSVRLFANMMAGHTLLKVIAGFAWSMMKGGGLLFLAHILPLAVLFILVGLELGVAIIQAYVFTVLTCIYLNDSINLH
uniref:ATP synthase subunit a n=1 Tax=Microchloropsis salina TaxID=2511165 RepID=T1R7G4_9STRA|nr:ATPase subunit 6 [Microchloropsis salina]AGI48936.1 ATPase subunit 6 [Microchloropsis salina]